MPHVWQQGTFHKAPTTEECNGGETRVGHLLKVIVKGVVELVMNLPYG